MGNRERRMVRPDRSGLFFFLGVLIFIQMAISSPSYALYTQVDRGKIHYNVAGNGSPVILIHGWMASSNYWEKAFNPLSRFGRVFSLDLPGYGKSERQEGGGYGISDLVKYLDRYIDKMGLEKVHLVGHSMGGIVAIQYALLHPEKVEKMVLVSSPFYPRPATLSLKLLRIPLLGRAIFWAGKGPIGRFYLKRAFFNEEKMEEIFMEDLERVSYRVMLSSMKSIQSIDLREKISDLKQPVLIIWGKEDRQVPVSVGKELQKGIKGSRLVIFDRCGHCPMVEWPQRFCHEVKTFLFQSR